MLLLERPNTCKILFRNNSGLYTQKMIKHFILSPSPTISPCLMEKSILPKKKKGIFFRRSLIYKGRTFCTLSALQVSGFGRNSSFQLANEKKMDPQQLERTCCSTATAPTLAQGSAREATLCFCSSWERV